MRFWKITIPVYTDISISKTSSKYDFEKQRYIHTIQFKKTSSKSVSEKYRYTVYIHFNFKNF